MRTDIKAWLVHEGRRTAVEPAYASKYSLWVRLDRDGSTLKDAFLNGSEFSDLIIELDGETFKLGACRLLPEPNIDGYAGKIVPIEELYDFEAFFFHKRVLQLTREYANLPLLTAHRNNIRQDFKNYVSDLTYDLGIRKSLFDRMEGEYRGEPPAVRNLIERSLIETKGREFIEYLNAQLTELERIVSGFSTTEHEQHGFYFRKQLWTYIIGSPIIARTNLKPRGYAGDSEMMRMIYGNEYLGDSLFSKLLHKQAVEQPGAEAVRSRRAQVAGLVHAAIRAKGRARRKIRILSVACGPALELNEILDSAENCRRIEITLFDQDSIALMEAAQVVMAVENRFHVRVKATYLRDSVRTVLFSPQLKEKWGQFHFIYSMGLFDYFTPPVARATLSKLYQLLKPGGEMVIGNFHVSNPSRIFMEYWLDWTIFYRTEDKFMDLANGLDLRERSILFDETGVQMLLHIIKGGGS